MPRCASHCSASSQLHPRSSLCSGIPDRCLFRSGSWADGPGMSSRVFALMSGEKALGAMVDDLSMSQPQVSKHLRVLSEVGLVRCLATTTPAVDHPPDDALRRGHRARPKSSRANSQASEYGFFGAVPPRTHRNHRLTCGYSVGRDRDGITVGRFPQVSLMGVQVGVRSQNGNSSADTPLPAQL
jgi:hypothetical protein